MVAPRRHAALIRINRAASKDIRLILLIGAPFPTIDSVIHSSFRKALAAMSANTTTIDVRSIAPRERHPLIFSTLGGLLPGAALELVNDHDPQPLYHQLQAQAPGSFEWAYLEQGPDTWRVQITRREQGSCCGGCCGSH